VSCQEKLSVVFRKIQKAKDEIQERLNDEPSFYPKKSRKVLKAVPTLPMRAAPEIAN
jgi:hypothetical protein